MRFIAFLYGGVIGAIAQGVLEFFMNVYHVKQEDANTYDDYYISFYKLFVNGIRYL